MRADVVDRDGWTHALSYNLAIAYVNRGLIAFQARALAVATAHFDRAIAELEVSESRGVEDPSSADGLALAYVNRGSAKAESQLSVEAIRDFDRAIGIWETQLAALERHGRGKWFVEFSYRLAHAYMARGTAEQNLDGHASAASDYDRAARVLEQIRYEVEPRGGWDPELQRQLAMAHANRAVALEIVGKKTADCRSNSIVEQPNASDTPNVEPLPSDIASPPPDATPQNRNVPKFWRWLTNRVAKLSRRAPKHGTD